MTQDPSDDVGRLRELFEGAVELPRAEQGAYLDRECGAESGLRARVEELLDHEREAASFLDGGAQALAGSARGEEWIGRVIGDYEIVATLGRGGAGIVYEAVQSSPRRRVALKRLQASIPGPEARRRFRLEAEVLGLLQHPGIAQVHHAGVFEADGAAVPFVAMELVEGARPVTRFAEERGLSVDARLRLFQQACAAVQFGHQKGIIHRDLKPGNLLVDREGQLKVIDFGLARVDDPELVCVSLMETRDGGLLGTLDYMSPEHVTGRALDVDARSDVYSLGCVLLELLARRAPRDLRGLSIPAAVQALQSEDPEIPKELPRELRWILVKTLERAPERRYGSPRELSDDLERYLSRESVLAVRPTAIYQLSKFSRRHRVLILATLAVIIALGLGLVRSNAEARRARAAEQDARVQGRVAQGVGDFLASVFQSANAYRGGSEARVADMVDFALSELESVEDPTSRAILASLVGEGFLNLGDDEHATELLETAHLELVALRGFEDPHAIHAGAVLADLLERKGEYERALALAEELDVLATAELGSGHRDVSYVRKNLAVLLGRLGRHEEAEAVLRETLARLRDDPATDRRSVLDTTFKLGQCLATQRRREEAVATLDEALELSRTGTFEDGLYPVVIRMGIASLHHSGGDYDAAEALHRQCVTEFDALGGTLSNRFAARANLASTLVQRGHSGGEVDLGEVARWIDECGALLEGAPGEPGRFTRMWLNLRSAHARLSGDTALALEVAEQFAALSRETFPDGDPDAASVYTTLGLALEAVGRIDEASAAFSEGRVSVSAAWGEGSRVWRALSRNHVRLLARHDRLEQARDLASEIERHTPREADDWPVLQDLVAELSARAGSAP